jgi:uncharacterized protein (DUF736 family)
MDNKYDNERKGVLFLKGSENPKAPKWSGKMTLGGIEYQIAAWEKMSKSGKEMLTISITDKPAGGYANSPKRNDYPPSPAVVAHNKAKANAYQKQHEDDDGDGIPF